MESIEERHGCKTVTGSEGKREEKILTTDGKRFVVVPIVLFLERAMSKLSEKKA